jgi:hypothetical protein
VPEFVVEKIIGQREWAPADDPTRKTVFYEFTAEGVEKVCSIGRKPDNPLKVGDRFEATSTEDRGKLKLRRVQSFGGGGFKADPKKDARITRLSTPRRWRSRRWSSPTSWVCRCRSARRSVSLS